MIRYHRLNVVYLFELLLDDIKSGKSSFPPWLGACWVWVLAHGAGLVGGGGVPHADDFGDGLAIGWGDVPQTVLEVDFELLVESKACSMGFIDGQALASFCSCF